MTQLTLLNRKDYTLPSASIYVAKKAKWLKDKLTSLAKRAKVVINEALHSVQLSIFKLKAGWWIVKKQIKWSLTDADVKKSKKHVKGINRLAGGYESLDSNWSVYEGLF
jgi:hypothetical protein